MPSTGSALTGNVFPRPAIIVAVTGIGVERGELDAGLAAALVGAGMLSVLIFPALALALRRRSQGGELLADPDDVPIQG